MNRTPAKKAWINRFVIIIIAAQLAYLVVVNAALHLPATQTLVNKIRPEKFQVQWEQAWSWYPFRVHVVGLSADGQSRSQQWQLDTPAASASIAVLPLLFKRVWVSNLDAVDVDFRLRPRLKEGKDYSRVIEYFPPIRDREVVAAETTPRKVKRPWHIALDDAQVSGKHRLWIGQARGGARGSMVADLRFETRGGPFSLDARAIDLDLQPMYLSGDEEVFQRGTLQGKLGFAPFVPRENKGVSLLEYLSLDVDVAVDLNSLRFINLFTLNFDGLAVDGSGRARGALKLDAGTVLPGSDLAIDASDLQVKVASHSVEGDGVIALRLGPQTDGKLDLAFQYRDLSVRHEEQEQPVLTGQGLRLSIGGNGRLLRDPEQPNRSRSLGFDIDGLEVPDLALLQRYLPAKWPLDLHGGNGKLRGFAQLTPDTLAVDLNLSSSRAALGVRDYRFDTNLDAVLKLDKPSMATAGTRVAGTYIRLKDATLTRTEGDSVQAPPWHASLELKDGQIGSVVADPASENDQAADILRRLGQTETAQLLDDTRAQITFEAAVSNLAWIGLLFGEDYDLGIAGSGKVAGSLHMAGALPVAGTDVQVSSSELVVDVLDYRSTGDGMISLKVEEGEEHPDWRVDIGLEGADLRRSDETVAYIQDVTLKLAALIPNVSLDGEAKAHALGLRIDSATVTDMATFNAYLPPDGSLSFAGGTAQLTAQLILKRDDADGWLRLVSKDVIAQSAEQSLSGDLEIDLLVVDGVPAEKRYDISGSELRLGNVQVSGDKEAFDQAAWSALVALPHTEVTLTRPPGLDVDARLSVSDSRPVVAMFNNSGNPPKFLSTMLTIEDIEGSARFSLADQVLTIYQAEILSDKVEVGARGRITPEGRDAVVYLRYKRADAVLKYQGEGKNMDIIGAREKYQQFQFTPDSEEEH